MARETEVIFTRSDNNPCDRIARIAFSVGLIVVIVASYAYYIHCKREQRAAKAAAIEQAATFTEPATVGETNTASARGVRVNEGRPSFKMAPITKSPPAVVPEAELRAMQGASPATKK